jgi:hypothetical protein
MSLNESRNHIKAQVWKAIAQSEIDLSSVPKSELDSLVSLVTDAALLEADDEIGKTAKTGQLDPGTGDEEILWEGRPFLSISKRYVITNERVRIFDGILGKDREDVELIRIQDVDQSQTFRERLLNLGDLNIRSHDSSDPSIVLNNIRDPQAVHEILRRAILNAREKYRLIYREDM